MVRTGLSMMRDPQSPFYIKPRLSWELMTWGWRFCRAANAVHVARSAPLLRDLHLASLAAYERLAAECGNTFGLTKRGLLMLCKTPEALEHEAQLAEQAKRWAFPRKSWTARRRRRRSRTWRWRSPAPSSSPATAT